MNSELLDKKVKWEAQRLALAFGAQSFECDYQSQFEAHFVGSVGSLSIVCYVDVEGDARGLFHLIEVSNPEHEFCSMHRPYVPSDALWQCHNHFSGTLNEFMARGIYRLGIAEEDIFAELKCHLSAHEKLEMRLSLPREFWPQQWLAEEGR